MAFAEKESNKHNYVYWNVSDNLDKHRETRYFDNHIQKMLLFVGEIGDFVAQEVPCGENGFYRTQLYNQKTGACVLIVHSYDKNAKYMK